MSDHQEWYSCEYFDTKAGDYAPLDYPDEGGWVTAQLGPGTLEQAKRNMAVYGETYEKVRIIKHTRTHIEEHPVVDKHPAATRDVSIFPLESSDAPPAAVCEGKELPDDGDVMPVFVLKARDNLATTAICAYYAGCICQGLIEQAGQVETALKEIMDWRESHRDECKWPDHEHVPAGQNGSGSERLKADALPAPAGDMTCEAHPGKPWPHDDCAGPGMPWSNYERIIAEQRATIASLEQRATAAEAELAKRRPKVIVGDDRTKLRTDHLIVPFDVDGNLIASSAGFCFSVACSGRTYLDYGTPEFPAAPPGPQRGPASVEHGGQK